MAVHPPRHRCPSTHTARSSKGHQRLVHDKNPHQQSGCRIVGDPGRPLGSVSCRRARHKSVSLPLPRRTLDPETLLVEIARVDRLIEVAPKQIGVDFTRPCPRAVLVVADRDTVVGRQLRGRSTHARGLLLCFASTSEGERGRCLVLPNRPSWTALSRARLVARTYPLSDHPLACPVSFLLLRHA